MTQGSEIRGSKAGNGSAPQNKGATATSQLHKIRQDRGIGATEIARRVGVSRQTIYAIESGDFVPNTAVALQLARVLEVSVEDLFSISAEKTDRLPTNIEVELLATGGSKYFTGELVRVGKVG